MTSTRKSSTASTLNREQWLTDAAATLVADLWPDVAEFPAYRVSCGFPATGGLGKRRRRIGECWAATVSAENVAQVFISPLLHDPVAVLSTLAHELIHVLHPDAGHKGAFVSTARSIGFEGPWTATTLSDGLADTLKALAGALPPYPHGAMTVARTDKVQTTRMLKAECPADGYVVRLSRKWAEVGMPTCPCGEELVLDEAD